MRGHFSIEWLAQSSQPAATESLSASTGSMTGLSTSGTNSESLPGFYCRQKSGIWQNEAHQESGNQMLDAHRLSSLTGSERNNQNRQSSHSIHNTQVTEAGFSSGTEEETSGYESEGGHSLSPVAPSDSASTSPPSPPSGRRPRTAFTAEQISSLEKAFKRNAYLGTQDKAELCKKLNLSDKQIRNWFQNRRMKLKRTVQDALAHACQANVASQLLHYPELQAYRPGPYPRYPPVHESPASAPYLHPPSLQYSSTSALPTVSALPLNSFCQYTSLPGMMLPSGTAPLMGSYQTYPQHY
ncbi:ventrally expressed dharma/bozozok antagonist [Myripristis murdjan]|uniref:ventrally expressed dharma/bozozok antagonist n=1 Tax=Myripristis murdjan TaxID=586833 RepID=UPI0011761D7F|nr:homeobox protein vent1-like [Myripristis murdjan]